MAPQIHLPNTIAPKTSSTSASLSQSATNRHAQSNSRSSGQEASPRSLIVTLKVPPKKKLIVILKVPAKSILITLKPRTFGTMGNTPESLQAEGSEGIARPAPSGSNEGQFRSQQAGPSQAGPSQSRQDPPAAEPIVERREIVPDPTTLSPHLPYSVIRARPENDNVTVDDTGVPIEEVHAFIRRMLRLANILGPNPTYPRDSEIHQQTVDGIVHLTMNWQSVHELTTDRYSLEHCTLRGRNVGTAIFSRVQATNNAPVLEHILGFLEEQAELAEQSYAEASANPVEAADFQQWGYASWMGTQLMDQRFFEAARDALMDGVNAELERNEGNGGLAMAAADAGSSMNGGEGNSRTL
ncbi:uncharacterized protein LY89DRAFT_676612 [Mollisia scopiformis]|uniref:Uncharacterized protein n=1 Tax=Mollisia scopiformis TaxID=149040 RepID=A0A132B8H7_MOLSC|nr:uncharacterized protein LY89DRAFT_676612 [Mollisia scopiformis]KUJ08706.1 hypothetical protein LY89DRAFT_676612 [Mollisia scopiformis]